MHNAKNGDDNKENFAKNIKHRDDNIISVLGINMFMYMSNRYVLLLLSVTLYE